MSDYCSRPIDFAMRGRRAVVRKAKSISLGERQRILFSVMGHPKPEEPAYRGNVRFLRWSCSSGADLDAEKQ